MPTSPAPSTLYPTNPPIIPATAASQVDSATTTTLLDAVPDDVTVAVGYTADAASFSTGSMALVKTVPYVAAHAAGCTGGTEGCLEYEERYRAERQWQSRWLAAHLSLRTM